MSKLEVQVSGNSKIALLFLFEKKRIDDKSAPDDRTVIRLI